MDNNPKILNPKLTENLEHLQNLAHSHIKVLTLIIDSIVSDELGGVGEILDLMELETKEEKTDVILSLIDIKQTISELAKI